MPEDSHDTYSSEFEPTAEQPTRKSHYWLWLFIAFDILVLTPALVVGGLWYIYNQAPQTFVPQTITIEPGDSVAVIAQKLEDKKIVRSALLLKLTLRLTQDATQIKAGAYEFTNPQTTQEIAEHLVSGDIVHELVSLTFVEGLRTQEYAKIARSALPSVTEAEFISLTKGMEGTLFPETYFVPTEFTAEELVALMISTHSAVTDRYQDAILTQGFTLDEALILASIIEREANTPESMRMVAGILKNRLDIGMALQTDASIEYVLDTPLGELPPGQLAAELRELDSPYNTYLYPGLPPTPIGNPGEIAISAVAYPIESDYFFYITGMDGEFYYAKTFAEHQQNIARYLR